MLRLNGGCKVVIAAPGGLKMDLAKSLDAADEYVELSRQDPSAQFEALKAANPYGFDIVVEATGSSKILEDSINYCRRGGKLVVYGVYSSKDRVSWAPSKICKFDSYKHCGLISYKKDTNDSCSLFQSVMRLPFSEASAKPISSLRPSTISTPER